MGVQASWVDRWHGRTQAELSGASASRSLPHAAPTAMGEGVCPRPRGRPGQNGEGKHRPPPGPESRQLLFHVTGKSSTATMFAFTVEAGAAYKNNTVQGKVTGSWTLPEPLTELLSPIPLPLY